GTCRLSAQRWRSSPPGWPTATTPASSPSASPAGTTASAGLKDGTYPGTGWSRHGSVSVSVTVQNGKITAAPITGVTTRYSQSVISGLPAKVVSGQSANVNMVSGATDSSTAYRSAVQQALAQAGGTSVPSNTGGSVQVTSPNGTIYQNPGANNGGASGFQNPGGPGGRRGRGGYGNYDN
ncbi:MAG: FMN-binding protein, partial [Chloroflexi bacterium]|nr:FMN-binding protein [Chloroflexota bacterium]